MAYDTYCALVVTKHTFGDKSDIVIDMGQQSVSDYTDELKTYTSEIDALNYMAKQGWELVSSYTNQNLFVSKHILRKKG